MRLHPLPFGQYVALCDVADEHGWKLWYEFVDREGLPIPKQRYATANLSEDVHSCRRQLTLVGGGFVLRAVEHAHGGASLDQLADELLAKVLA